MTPGSSTTTRSLPWVTTTGSETPVVLTRRSTMSLMIAMSPEPGGPPSTGKRLVFDAQAALEIEAQLRLDPAPAAVDALRVGHGEPREEVHEQGEGADEQDQDRASFTHRGGMLHGTTLDRPGGTALTSLGQASRVALIRAARAGPIPGTAAICSTGASRTRLIEPNTLSSSRLRFGPTPGRSSKAERTARRARRPRW